MIMHVSNVEINVLTIGKELWLAISGSLRRWRMLSIGITISCSNDYINIYFLKKSLVTQKQLELEKIKPNTFYVEKLNLKK